MFSRVVIEPHAFYCWGIARPHSTGLSRMALECASQYSRGGLWNLGSQRHHNGLSNDCDNRKHTVQGRRVGVGAFGLWKIPRLRRWREIHGSRHLCVAGFPCDSSPMMRTQPQVVYSWLGVLQPYKTNSTLWGTTTWIYCRCSLPSFGLFILLEDKYKTKSPALVSESSAPPTRQSLFDIVSPSP